jgi:hypothetical protein
MLERTFVTKPEARVPKETEKQNNDLEGLGIGLDFEKTKRTHLLVDVDQVKRKINQMRQETLLELVSKTNPSRITFTNETENPSQPGTAPITPMVASGNFEKPEMLVAVRPNRTFRPQTAILLEGADRSHQASIRRLTPPSQKRSALDKNALQVPTDTSNRTATIPFKIGTTSKRSDADDVSEDRNSILVQTMSFTKEPLVGGGLKSQNQLD